MRRAGVAICVVLFAGVTLTTPALAGDYTVYACRADDSGRNLSWTAGATSSHMLAYTGGCGSSGEGIVARARIEPSGSEAGAFDAANWAFQAPAGATISQVALSGRLYRAAGTQWGVGMTRQDGSYLLGGISSNFLGWESAGYTTVPGNGATRISFGVICATASGCPTSSTGDSKWGSSRARADLYGARVKVSEDSPPTLSAVRGSLVSGAWVGGTATVGFSASDPVGVARQRWSIDEAGETDTKSCDYARTAPCPASTGSDFTVNTRGLGDGERKVTLSATDSAGNVAGWTGTARIDNNNPGPPGQPVLQGSPAAVWRAANGFTITYSNPSRDGGAPLASHDVQTCPVDAAGSLDLTDCYLEDLAGAPGADTVQLPGPGRFRVRVRVDDSLYAGEWGPWSETLRLDDTVPGPPTANFPSRWINAQAARGSLLLAPPAGSSPQPSGINAYLVSGTADGAPVRIDAGPLGTASLPYSMFSEGSSGIAVRAVSGAGLTTPTTFAATAEILKDTVPPALAVSGSPATGSFVASAVTLEASATDTVSGMSAAPPGRPASEGGFISFLSAGGSPQLFGGPLARLSPGEGHHVITTTATDLAGNVSAPVVSDYTQDSRAPTGGLLPAPTDSPSSLRFLVGEDCPGQASVEISTSPGSWTALPTSLVEGTASSRVPPAVWNAEIPYTVRAEVTDCAGNHATLTRWAAGPRNGEPIGELTPPPREQTSISAAVRRPARRASAPASSTRIATARVRDANGDPAPGVRVVFESQPRVQGAEWTAVASDLSSRTGEASRAVDNRYSQRIRARVAESDLVAPSYSNVITTSVEASSTISASPTRLRNGRSVRISGRLRGGLVPAAFEVALYGLGPRARTWVPVRSAIAVSRSGRWSTGYRFRSTRTRTRYRFRIRIPSRPDYPFTRGYSPSRSVTVFP